LVVWLNGLPEAQALLVEKFEGRAISAQNLSEWKKGGYEDWVRHQENCAYANILAEMAGDLEEEAGVIRLEERLATLLAMALARLLREAEESTDDDYRRKTVLEVGRQLAQLRRGNQQAARLRLAREALELRQDEADDKLDQAAAEEAEAWEQVKAEVAGSGPERVPGRLTGCRRGSGEGARKARSGWLALTLILCPRRGNGLGPRRVSLKNFLKGQSTRIQPDQTGSDLSRGWWIKPNQPKTNRGEEG
jgi:hypothetical protein